VITTAGPRSARRLEQLGVEAVFDYHDPLADASDALGLVTHGRAGGAVVLRP
jgi:hypothetical protein